MARARRFSPLLALLALAAVGLASSEKTALAQQGAGAAQKPGSPHAGAQRARPGAPGFSPAPATVNLNAPSQFRVYQRDVNDKADIPVVLDDFDKEGSTLLSATVTPNPGNAKITFNKAESKLVGVPVGGPYTIFCQVEHEGLPRTAQVANIYVGDLWVLAGQSNMEGVGDLVDVAPPHPRVMLLGMDGRWGMAEEPLHWLVDSPDPVHSGDASSRAARSTQTHKTRKKGAGLGLPFAVTMVESTGVPVGLVACAHGGTSMEQWNPSKKEQGGKSLYGSMLRQVKAAGGKVKGVLWYQGESDSLGQGEAWKAYPRVFSDFIAAVRSDFAQPDLPFYYVQIGRFIAGFDPKGWNAVQDAQRTLPERVPNTAVVSVIDLELDDGIHVGTQGLKRAGQRLARVALREQFGQLGATTPTLDRVARGPNTTLVLKFKGVNMSTHLTKGGGGRGFAPGSFATGMAFVGPNSASPGDASSAGLKPERNIAGFSIRKEDGTSIPLIFEAAVGKARDTVILKLSGPVPPHAALWYGHGLNTYCNLTDGLDMAVPVFGPIDLDETSSARPAGAAAPVATRTNRVAQADADAVKVLIITGDTVSAHNWKETTAELTKILEAGGKAKVSVTTTPSKDLSDENLSKYDVLLLNYKDTAAGAPETHWSEANKEAFLKSVREGKGLAVFHHASGAFTSPNWDEFEKAIAGGWRSKGFHGPPHVFNVKKTEAKHPISDGLSAQFEHKIDELYQNSVMVPGNTVLATAYSDPSKPRGTGKDEPVIWVNTYGKGRVYENSMGHNLEAMSDPQFQEWMRRGVIWAGNGKVD
jgi:type 1 glutamine amidotransferase